MDKGDNQLSTPPPVCCAFTPSTWHYQHHSANNVVQPSSATFAGTVAPRRETPGIVNAGGGSWDGGTGTAGDSRRQQSPHQDHHHDVAVSAAVVAGWGRRPPKLSTGVEEVDGDVPVPADTSSRVLRAGREELESKDDVAPAGRDVGQSGASNIIGRSPSFYGSCKGPVSSPSQRRCFSSGLEHQDAVSASRRASVCGQVSSQCVNMEAGVTASAAPAAAVVAPTQAPGRTMTRGAIDEVGAGYCLASRTVRIGCKPSTLVLIAFCCITTCDPR